MKKLILSAVLLTALLTLTACYRNDIRTETFYIEQMRTPQREILVSKSLQQLHGIQESDMNHETQTLTVKFDGRLLYLKNIEDAIVNAGFSLPNHPAKPADIAKLPKDLQ